MPVSSIGKLAKCEGFIPCVPGSRSLLPVSESVALMMREHHQIQATYSFLERHACAVDPARLAEYPRAYHRGVRKFPADTPRAPRTHSTSTHLQLSAAAPDSK